MTTAGWAMLVMVVVTALAAWPVSSAPTSPTRRSIIVAGRRPRRGRPAGQGHPARSVRRSEPGRLQGQAAAGRPGQRHGRPRRCSTGTGCAACSARPTARPRRSTARRSTTRKSLTWDEAETIRAQPGTPATAIIKAQAAAVDEGRRADQDRGPGGVRVPAGHQGHGADRRRLHRGAGLAAVRAVRPHRVAAGAARLPDLPVGGDRRADPRHGRPAAAGQRRAPAAGQRGGGRALQHRHLRHRRRRSTSSRST